MDASMAYAWYTMYFECFPGARQPASQPARGGGEGGEGGGFPKPPSHPAAARRSSIVMSTVPTTKWEANLHGANFWIHGCGGHSKVLQNTGLRIWMLELLYDEYCAPFDIPRVTLFYTCMWLKHYPHDALLPRY